jgi:iron-sulfur cluster repair protein YtfE (RIC family)
MSSADKVIADIVREYPEDEWMDRCREALPGSSEGFIMSGIEICCGGDVILVDEDGNEVDAEKQEAEEDK